MFRLLVVSCCACLGLGAALYPQSTGLTMPMPMPMPMAAGAGNPFLVHSGSGTSVEPASTPAPMLMAARGGWTFMLHGVGFLSDIQQSGARGRGQLFSTNWAMAMAARSWGAQTLTLRSMLSLEPATVTGRQYPELFQTGETAFGLPIVDGQHPHNFFMELAALYDYRISPRAAVSLYLAPMGDPAIGPTAYPHRAAAAEDPIATLGHHLEDSTHISDDVVTAGLSYGFLRAEGSAFHGREPDEHRWRLESGRLDSWSGRLSALAGRDWSAQYSLAHITSPELLDPGVNQLRTTASVMNNHPFTLGNLASAAVWGRTRDLGGRNIYNGYLLESTLGFAGHNHAWTRVENVDKSNQLELGENPEPPGFVERPLGRVQACSFGYDRDLPTPGRLPSAIGAQWTLYQAPPVLRPIYGDHPQGVVVFVRVRVGGPR